MLRTKQKPVLLPSKARGREDARQEDAFAVGVKIKWGNRWRRKSWWFGHLVRFCYPPVSCRQIGKTPSVLAVLLLDNANT